MANETITIVDNRTNQSYTLPIYHGTIRAMDLRQIKTGPDDFGLMTYDPAYMNTAACHSAVTYLDGEQRHPALPRLSHRTARRALHFPRGRLPSPIWRVAELEGPGVLERGNHGSYPDP